jgi:hypothetical protein
MEEVPHVQVDKTTQPALVTGHLSAGTVVAEMEITKGSI